MAELKPMWNAHRNSLETRLTNSISATDTQIIVDDVTKIPPVPTLLVIGGTQENAETVLVTAINGNMLTVTRGFQSTEPAQSWGAGQPVSRNYTALEHDNMVANIMCINDALGDVSVPESKFGFTYETPILREDVIETRVNELINETSRNPFVRNNWRSCTDGDTVYFFTVNNNQIFTFNKNTYWDIKPFVTLPDNRTNGAYAVTGIHNGFLYWYDASLNLANGNFYRLNLTTLVWETLTKALNNPQYGTGTIVGKYLVLFTNGVQINRYDLETQTWLTSVNRPTGGNSAYATCCADSNGYVYVFGNNTDPFNLVSRYDPVANVILARAVNTARYASSCLGKDENGNEVIYLAGDGTTFRRYNIANNNYTSRAANAGDMGNSTMFLMPNDSNRLMVLGGDVSNSLSNRLFKVYDITTNVWRYGCLPNRPNSNQNQYWVSCTDGRYIYMFGGTTLPYNAFYRIDTENDYAVEILPPPLEFTTAADFGYHGPIMYHNGKIYRSGGNNATFNKNMYVYTIATKTWNMLSAVCPFEWQDGARAIINDKWYVSASSAVSLFTAAYYDFNLDTWVQLPNDPADNFWSKGGAYGDKFVVIGGGGSVAIQFRVFDTVTETWSIVKNFGGNANTLGDTIIKGDRLYVGGIPVNQIINFINQTTTNATNVLEVDLTHSMPLRLHTTEHLYDFAYMRALLLDDRMYLIDQRLPQLMRYWLQTIDMQSEILADIKAGQRVFYSSLNKTLELELNGDIIPIDEIYTATTDGFIKTVAGALTGGILRGWVYLDIVE
jgi:hypothetical protein